MQNYEPTIASGLWKYSLLFFFGFKTFGERAQAERAGKTVAKMEKDHR